uniref:Uncharacterized protein n=1 Tax=Tanacetum cinerariifolium TaxID=118510 RepID=A0A699HJK4_TANCI|nr:hypothetical protein [Tanacetum cinerariifolium]
MQSDEVTESNAENLLPIPSECEVTLEDKRECDELICENSSTIDVCDNHSEILFDSNNDDLSSNDKSFEDIEYVDASVPNPAIISVEEENVVHREKEEKLINLVENDNSDSSNDPLLEEVDLFLSDDSIPPGIENIADDREGDIRFLEELLINDSILSHELSDSNFEDNPSISRHPPELPRESEDTIFNPEILSGEIKVHLEVLSVLWGNRLPIPGGSLPLSRRSTTVDRWSDGGKRWSAIVDRHWLPLTIDAHHLPLQLTTVDRWSGVVDRLLTIDDLR